MLAGLIIAAGAVVLSFGGLMATGVGGLLLVVGLGTMSMTVDEQAP